MPLYDVYRADGSVTRVEASSKSEASASVRYAGEWIRQVVEVTEAFTALRDSDTALPTALPVAQDWRQDWQLIGTVQVKSISDLESKARDWDTQFRAGEKGVLILDFPIPYPADLPDWMFPFKVQGLSLEPSKDGVMKNIKSVLEARGVELWRYPEWEGNELRVYYTTGLATLAIAIIVVGALIAIGIIAITVSNYKIKEQEVIAYNERQRELNDAFLDAVNQIDDPAERAKLLDDRARHEAEDYGVGKTPSLVEAGVDVFKTPALVIGIGIAVFFVVWAVLKAVRK